MVNVFCIERKDTFCCGAGIMAEKKMMRRITGLRCRFCREKRKADYKDIAQLSKLLSGEGKIYSRKRSGNCAFHQRQVEHAIKRARFMALLPYC